MKSLFKHLSTSKAGTFITIIAITLVAIIGVRSCQHRPTAVDVSMLVKKNLPSGVIRPKSDPPKSVQIVVVETNVPVPADLLPIHFGTTNQVEAEKRVVLPSRRLIPCTLVNTVDSSSLETPIIGLVSGDVFWQEQLIVQKGTEVHGRAQGTQLRDRIGSQGPWVLIRPSGEEISINGIALDMDQQEGQWGPTDGSSGLRGTRTNGGQPEEAKLFLATVLGGITQSSQQRQTTALGTQVVPTLQNAALGGASAVINSYAERLLRTIEGEFTFVRVTGGKAFYLYTLDPIDSPTKATP